MKLIDKDVIITEIESKRKYAQNLGDNAINSSMQQFYDGMKQGCVDILSFINTLEVIDPYITCIQYTNREAAIKAHAEDYSWNIESELFQQLTTEQQKLWRKEIEQACISGGYCGLNLQKDRRYDDTSEVKEMNTWHLQEKENIYDAVKDWGRYTFACIMKDGTIQRFTGSLDEDIEGHINVHVNCVNDNYDDVDDIVKWIEFT